MLSFRRFVWRTLRLAGPPPGMSLADAGDLFEQAMELNEQGEYRKALKIARELDRYRYTGAWEIEAVALRQMGDADRAIEILRQGIEKMPVWRIGHLLGICLSDEGRYEDALAAFDASLGMLEPQPKMTAYNRAIVFKRSGHTEEAVRILREIVSSGPCDEPKAVELASAYLADLTGKHPKKPPPRRQSIQRPNRGRRRR